MGAGRGTPQIKVKEEVLKAPGTIVLPPRQFLASTYVQFVSLNGKI